MDDTGIFPVVDYFRQVAADGADSSLEEVLQGLAKVVGAEQAGLSDPEGGAPDVVVGIMSTQPLLYPWLTDASLVAQADASMAADVCRDKSGAWLFCLVREPRVGGARMVWARRSTGRPWAESDRWAWLFASQALMRQLARTEGGNACVGRSLEQAAAVTGRLAHDFGNYLTGILGFTELGMSHAPAEGLLPRYLQEVLQSAKDGAAWIHRLHLFCRRGPARSWPTVLSSLLAEEENHLRQVSSSTLAWSSDVPSDLPLVGIDADSVQTMLTELLTNACDACRERGSIAVEARARDLSEADCRGLLGAARPGSYVVVSVADDGPGIPPESRARLFREVFFSTKARHRGLGLLIVYGILQRFGGALQIESSERGTTVRLFLPVAAIEGPDLSSGESPHVLLVHANPILYEGIRRILESRGCRVSMTTSAPTALAVYKTPGQSVALVVTEVQLPQVSGLELARRLLDRDAKARFLFLHTQTSFHGLGEEDLLKRFALLRWPFDPPALLNAVRRSLGAPGE